MATLLLLLVNAFFIPAMPGALGEMFQISPANATGLNGADLTLSCHANSAPADVRWTKDGVYVQASTSITISHNAGGSSILFSPVGYPREGVYRCVALDAEGTELFSSFPGEVNVLGQPSIITPPESQSVVVGGTAQFSCDVAGDPAPSVSWQFAHLPLPSGSKYSIQTDPHRLTVTDVRPTDAGFYDCNATNLYGSSFVSARLSIAQVAGDRPVVMVSPGDSITALEGTSQSITCYTSTTPTPAVYWTRNNMAITESSELSVTHLAGNSTLTFRALSPSHDGMYQCFANNTHGSDSVTVLLSVLVVPVVTRQPVNITVRAGEVPGTTVRCEASGNPQPAISILDSDGRIVSPAGVWVVPSLARGQGGAYSCVASSLAGTDSSSFIVSVEDVPLITQRPQNATAVLGGEVTLACSARGPPDPVSLTWRRQNGSAVAVGQPLAASTGSTVLRLASLLQSDGGQYVCEASNAIGSTTATATVSITVIPTVYILPRNSFVPVGESVVLECIVTPPLSSSAFQWSVNGTQINGETQPTLSIQQIAYFNSGTYTCKIDTYTATATVVVGTRPVVTLSPPEQVLLSPGNQITLDCMGTGDPIPKFKWEFVNEMGERNDVGDTTNIRIYTNNSLLLRNVNKLLSGRYICVIDNGVGKLEPTATVSIEGSPVVMAITPSTIVRGNQGVLTCHVIYNNPAASVVWAYPGSSAAVSGNILSIANVQLSDEGVYTCTATNSYGTHSLTQAVTVYVTPTARAVNSTVTAYIDSSFEVECVGAGVPPPNVTWAAPGGGGLAADTSTLRLSSVQLDSIGVYTCTATNEVGSSSDTMQVIVQGAPATQLNLVSVTTTSVTITWASPPLGLRAQLILFSVSYGPTRGPASEYTDVQPESQRLVAGQLDEGTEYEFVIRGLYLGNHMGEAAAIKATTIEILPTAPPQNVTITTDYYSELSLRWRAPPVMDRNGVLIGYNIFYRRTQEDPSASANDFVSLQAPPTGLHFIIRDLEGNASYDVMMQAVNSMGGGPNTTIIEVQTTRLPLELILGVSIGGGGLLVLIVLALLVCCCCCIWRRRRKGELDMSKEHKSKKSKKLGISGPIADDPPFIDPYNPGKFGVMSHDGTLVALQPKIITSYDIAPPPMEGQTAERVRQVKLKQSAPLDIYSEPLDSLRRASDRPESVEMQVVSEAFDYMNEWDEDTSGDISPYAEAPNSFESLTADDLIQPLDEILNRSSSKDGKLQNSSLSPGPKKDPIYAKIAPEHVQMKQKEKLRNARSKDKVMKRAMEDYQQRIEEYHPKFNEPKNPLLQNEYVEPFTTTSFDYGMQDLVQVDDTSALPKMGKRS